MDLKKIEAMFESFSDSSMSINEFRKRHEISYNTYKKYLSFFDEGFSALEVFDEMERRKRKKKFSIETIKILFSLFEKGKTYTEIKAAMEISDASITRYKNKFNQGLSAEDTFYDLMEGKILKKIDLVLIDLNNLIISYRHHVANIRGNEPVVKLEELLDLIGIDKSNSEFIGFATPNLSGYQMHFKNPINWHIQTQKKGMNFNDVDNIMQVIGTYKIVMNRNRLNRVVFVTGDKDFLPLISLTKQFKLTPIIVAISPKTLANELEQFENHLLYS